MVVASQPAHATNPTGRRLPEAYAAISIEPVMLAAAEAPEMTAAAGIVGTVDQMLPAQH